MAFELTTPYDPSSDANDPDNQALQQQQQDAGPSAVSTSNDMPPQVSAQVLAAAGLPPDGSVDPLAAQALIGHVQDQLAPLRRSSGRAMENNAGQASSTDMPGAPTISEEYAAPVTPIQQDRSLDIAAENEILRQERLDELKTYLRQPGIEGFTNPVQLDTQGHLTAGCGHEVQPGDHLKMGDAVPQDVADRFLQKDSVSALSSADQQAHEAQITDPNFITHLAAVNFQLGNGWIKKFPKTYADMVAGNYRAAANEVALGADGKSKSLWMQQTPRRVMEFQNALRVLAPKATP